MVGVAVVVEPGTVVVVVEEVVVAVVDDSAAVVAAGSVVVDDVVDDGSVLGAPAPVRRARWSTCNPPRGGTRRAAERWIEPSPRPDGTGALAGRGVGARAHRNRGKLELCYVTT